MATEVASPCVLEDLCSASLSANQKCSRILSRNLPAPRNDDAPEALALGVFKMKASGGFGVRVSGVFGVAVLKVWASDVFGVQAARGHTPCK